MPIPGSDDGTWGDILNAFLEVSHASDGTLNSNVVGTVQLQDNAVTNAKLDSSTQTTIASIASKYVKPAGGIPSSDMTSAVQTSLSSANTAVQSVNSKTGTSISLTAGDVGALPAGPVPTGVAATDTANVQAALTAAAGGVCYLTQPGTFAINATLIRPSNASIFLGPNTILQASTTIAGPVLSDSPTTRSLRQSIVGGGIIDSNNLAQNALWLRYFQRGMVLGVICMNSTQSDVILGDVNATAASNQAYLTEWFMTDRKPSFPVPVGYYSVWFQNCTDSMGIAFQTTGQETGIRVDGSDCKFFNVHSYGAESQMHCAFDDNSLLNEWIGCIADTPTPSLHSGATGSNANNTITDSAILPQHKGVPVSGTNIPAHSFVGTVTSGVSFQLVSSGGATVTPTGPVSGVTLAGVGIMCRGAGTRIIGGNIYVSTIYGVDNGCYGVVFGSSANTGFVDGFSAYGGSGSFRVTQAIVGNSLACSWTSLLQVNCANTNPAQNQLAAQHGATLNLTNNTAGNFLTVENTSGTVLALIDSSGAIFQNSSPNTPGLLAYIQYTAMTTYTTTSTTLVSIDSTNLTITFRAPPSGNVLIRLEATIENQISGDKVAWALIDHVGLTQQGSAGIASPSNTNGIRPLTILVTGLTSGTSYQYDWAWAVSAGTAQMTVQPVVSPWTNVSSPATMEVWAA